MAPTLPKVVAIIGSTASGKTSLGIEIAKRFHGEVISVDSRQVYRGMDIGTAKSEGTWEQSESESNSKTPFGRRWPFVVQGVNHWGIDLVEPDAEFSVAEFKTYAEEKITDILGQGHVPLLVGGTGLWFQVLIDNLEIPSVPPQPVLRAKLEARTTDELFAEFEHFDPFGAETIDRFNRRRLIRALEVIATTGQPFSAQQRRGSAQYDVLQIGLDVPRVVLYRRIDERVEAMIARGLVDEVRQLKEKYGSDATSMSGIGYRQICRFLDGKQSLSEAIMDIKKDTRNYAKRQVTWFRRDSRIRWIGEPAAAAPIVEAFLQET